MRGLLRGFSPSHDLAPHGERAAMARGLAVLPAPVVFLAIVWMALPHPALAYELAVVGCVLVSGALHFGFWRAATLSPGKLSALFAADAWLIAVALICTQTPIGVTALLYLWALPTAFAIFGFRHALVQYVNVGISYAAALALLPEVPGVSDATAWTTLVVTLGVLGGGLRLLILRLRTVERRFQRAFDDSPLPMVVVDLDGRLTGVNHACCAFLGRAREALIGTTPADWTHPDDAALDVEASLCEQRFRRGDGRWAWGRVTSGPVRDRRGQVVAHQLHIEDVTARHAAADEARFAAAALARRARLSGVLAEVARLAVETGDRGKLTRRAAALVADALEVEHCAVAEVRADGSMEVVALTTPVSDWAPGARIAPTPGGLIALTLERREPLAVADIDADPRVRTRDAFRAVGLTAAVTCALRRPGETLGLLAAFSTMTRAWAPEEVEFIEMTAAVLASGIERSRAEADARRRALTDTLTGLPNRDLFRDRLTSALARARRGAPAPAVLLLDFDQFKVLNDSLGHHAGDALLRAIAPRLQDALRATDTVARLGGDEFVVLADAAGDEATALQVAARIEAAIAEPVGIGGATLHTSASIGVALATPASDADSLLRDADAAMYAAKRRGRGRVEVFGAPLRAVALRRLELEQDLRSAIANGELHLEYQPVRDLTTGAVFGLEALMRWTHPVHGRVSPGEFIAVAEESGLILSIGRWALRTACAEAAGWPGAVAVGVNLSARQLTDPDLRRHVEEALSASGLPAQRLVLEITESVLVEHDEGPLRVLAELRAMGIKISLDDFGTGYSSLSYLRRIPLDSVKIDRAFVSDLGVEPSATALVEGVVHMGHALGLRIVAEGIETAEQEDALRRLGADLGQGWRLGRPERGDVVAARLAATAPVATLSA